MRPERPNILFIMADQMAATALPVYGHPIVQAPHLSALAEDGVVFDSAYCNSPLCAPSRSSMMAGRLPSGIGVHDNAADFPADHPTFAHYLRLAGYRTALSGKMHFCGPDQLHGFEERLTTDIYPADYGWTPDWENTGARATWFHNLLSVVQAGPCVRSNQLDFDDEVNFMARRWLYEHVRGSDSRPFCLLVSMTHPHDPYAISPGYWERYAAAEIDLPQVQLNAEQQDPHSLRLRQVSDMDRYQLTPEQIGAARRAYYGAISYVDDQIGALLGVLEETALAEDTIVVFTADHGDMLGERGLWYKMTWFEGAARVPMIFHAPRHFAPRRVTASVSLVDLLPTLAALANDGETPELAAPVDGRSLLPHLAGSDGHDEVIGEYLGEGAIDPLLMIRRGPYKYVCSRPDPEQLFDLANDPRELANLAPLPEHDELLQGFRDAVSRRWDLNRLRAQVLASQRRRRLVSAALRQGAHTAWDHHPGRDASRQYVRNHMDLDDLESRSRFPRAVQP